MKHNSNSITNIFKIFKRFYLYHLTYLLIYNIFPFTFISKSKRSSLLNRAHSNASMSLDFDDVDMNGFSTTTTTSMPLQLNSSLRTISMNDADDHQKEDNSNISITSSLPSSPTFQKNSFLSSSSLIQPTSPSTSPSTSSLSPTTTTFKPPSISPLKLSPRVRSATSFGEMNSYSENMNGIVSAPNSPLTRRSNRKTTKSFDQDNLDNLEYTNYTDDDTASTDSSHSLIRSLVSPTHQLRSSLRNKRNSVTRNNSTTLSPPLKSTPSSLHVNNKISQQHPKLSVAIRKKALRIMCKAKLCSSDDLLILICDPHLDPELRTEAVRMCGLYHLDFKKNGTQIKRKLNELLGKTKTSIITTSSKNKKTTSATSLLSNSTKNKISDLLKASAAVSLLRITDWQHTNAHIVLYKMLHEQFENNATSKKNKSSRVIALELVGKELPELISDGYLVYLLHVACPGSSLLEATVRCCSGRRSIILLPLLFQKLSDPSLRELVINALITYNVDAVLLHAKDAMNVAVTELSHVHNPFNAEQVVGNASLIHGVARWMTKIMSLSTEGYRSKNTETTKERCITMTQNVLETALNQINQKWPNNTKHTKHTKHNNKNNSNNSNNNHDNNTSSNDASTDDTSGYNDHGDHGGTRMNAFDSISLANFVTILTPLINFLVFSSSEPVNALSKLKLKLNTSAIQLKEDQLLHDLLNVVIRTIQTNIYHLNSVEEQKTTETTTKTTTETATKTTTNKNTKKEEKKKIKLIVSGEKLQNSNLNSYINQIETMFDNDLNAITSEWMQANMKQIHIRRLQTLIATETASNNMSNTQPSSTSSTTATVTLQLVRLGALLRKNVRLLMKICAIRFFPSSLSVDLLFQSYISVDDEHRAAANEVLDNMLNSHYRELVLPILSQWHEADKKLLDGEEEDDEDDEEDEERSGNSNLSPLSILRVLMHSPLFENVALEDIHQIMEHEGTITQNQIKAGKVVTLYIDTFFLFLCFNRTFFFPFFFSFFFIFLFFSSFFFLLLFLFPRNYLCKSW